MRHFIIAPSGLDYYIINERDWNLARSIADRECPGWRAMFTDEFFVPELFETCLGELR